MCTQYQNKRISLLLSLVLGVLSAGAALADGRFTASLDGAWAFRMDPEDVGETQGWFSAQVPFEDTIQAPGAWEAQGFGAPTDKLRHHFIGKGWYKRDVVIPQTWAGRHVFLCFGGVHRYAAVWVNGQFLGEHIGYLSPFEFDVTGCAPPGTTALIAVRVDSEQRWDVDTMIGAFDLIDYMDTYWGGIWSHVSLEARNDVYLRDVFVQPAIEPPGCRVSAEVVGTPSADSALRIEVFASDGQPVANRIAPLQPLLDGAGAAVLDLALPGAQLWTPETPVLYTAQLSVIEGSAILDAQETRFGLRRIVLDGTHVLLNGRRITLRGYGDDAIYPKTVAAPSDKNAYFQKLTIAKSYGFNFVRHHSHFLPPEYYEACDEIGMLVSAEFPIAYSPFFQRAKGPALELYPREWEAVIKRFRNHPSIFDWSMCNEMYDGMPLAADFYRIAKQLDPTRPVADTDGLPMAGFLDGSQDRDTNDLYFVQFDVFNSPIDLPDKFASPAPRKPVVSHETGNYVTFPRFDMIDLFQDDFIPFWLLEARDKVARMSLLDEAPLWADHSERLYFLLHKSNIEAIRKRPNLSGYHWWLLQDYWTTSNGLVDTYLRPKPAIDREQVRQFNAEEVLLQDGIALTYRGGESLEADLLFSNYGSAEWTDPALTYRLRLADEVVAEQTQTVVSVAQGVLERLAHVSIPLPGVAVPTRLKIEVELRSGDARVVNDWFTWVFPAQTPPPKMDRPLFAGPDLVPWLGRLGAQPFPEQRPLPTEAVYVASQVTPALIDAAVSGASLLLVKPQGVFPAARTRFKTAWWKGSPSDNNAGTVVYDNPATKALAPEGWCDTAWYRLIEGCDGYLLDTLPERPGVLIRGIEVACVCRDKALLFQAACGQGALIVCGLNLDAILPGGAPCPAAEWLTARLIEYAAAPPQIPEALPEIFLRDRVGEMPQFDAPYVEGYARLLRNEGEQSAWFTYREVSAPTEVCRQTEPGHVVEWETAPVPKAIAGDSVTFVFAGGLGWISQPASDGFALAINDREALHFDVCLGAGTWRSAAGDMVLSLFPKRLTQEDTAGLFYLSVPAAWLEPGQPCRLAVRSLGSGTQRWFALHPYTDVLGVHP